MKTFATNNRADEAGADLEGPGVAMATPNGRLATPVATPFLLIDIIVFIRIFETISQSASLHPNAFGPHLRCHPITHKLALPLFNTMLYLNLFSITVPNIIYRKKDFSL